MTLNLLYKVRVVGCKGLLYLQQVGEGGMLVFLLLLDCHSHFPSLWSTSLSSSLLALQKVISLHRRVQQHSLVEIDHEIFSKVIFSLPLIQEGQLSASGERMCKILVNRLED